jgi:phage-related tail fiber protein
MVEDGSVSTNDLQQGAVTADKLAPNAAIPAGAVMSFAMSAAPVGWLPCDGSAINRTAYSALFNVVGTIHGVGDGSNTFNVPDLRGEFIRGWSAGRDVDTGRVFGTAQQQDWKGFYFTNTETTYSHEAYMGKTIYPTWSGTRMFMGKWEARFVAGVGNLATGTLASWDSSEVRPRNIALLYCIKF